MAEHSAKTGISLGNSMYDTLRRIVEFILPGLGALYFALAQFWGFPNAEEVVGSLAALTIFGGVLLAASRKSYQNDGQYDGVVVADETDPDNTSYRFELKDQTDAEALLAKKQIVFKGLDEVL